MPEHAPEPCQELPEVGLIGMNMVVSSPALVSEE